MSRMREVLRSGGYLKTTAHLGHLAVLPSILRSDKLFSYNSAVDIKKFHPRVTQTADLAEISAPRQGWYGGMAGNPCSFRYSMSLGMGGERPALCQLKVEDLNVQPAPGTDLGVLLAQGARSSIAGIGHQGLAPPAPAGR